MTAQLDHREPSDAEVEAAVATLKLLADATRLRIIWALLHGEHAVNDLAEHVGVQPAVVSQHLSKLRLAHLVQVRRDGNRMHYSAQDEHIAGLAAEALFHAERVTGQPAHHQRERSA